jgi:site-specific recombinase XerD
MPTVSWEEALRSFLLHYKGSNRAPKTVEFYRKQLDLLARWAECSQIPVEGFGKRQIDAYLAERVDHGISPTTLHHDALCAKVFMKWCVRYDVIPRNLLADYQVATAPVPYKYMPTQENITKLLWAVSNYYDRERNPDARYISAAKRSFHRDRNYALVLLLLDTACRVGEVMSLKLDNWQEREMVVKGTKTKVWHVTVEKAKGKRPRSIPVSATGAQAVNAWLRVRSRIMKEVPASEDEGYVFITEMGTRIDEGKFLKALKRIVRFAELPDMIGNHSLRRYSLNKLAKTDLLGAQRIAGHRRTETTLIYTELDPEHVLDVHTRAAVVDDLVTAKRPPRKRLV